MKTVLVVEDDEAFREMLRAALESRGFAVLIAENTGEGLETAACKTLDAVLTDYHMPKTNGLQFCRALVRQNAALGQRIPVWLMTGSIDLKVGEARDAGAQGIFRKPFHVHEISDVIESCLRPAPSSVDVMR